jgi:hypothetical protein
LHDSCHYHPRLSFPAAAWEQQMHQASYQALPAGAQHVTAETSAAPQQHVA